MVSCVIWGSRLTTENKIDLERVQKAAVRIILNKSYESYNEALIQANLETLEKQREKLHLNFAKTSAA